MKQRDPLQTKAKSNPARKSGSASINPHAQYSDAASKQHLLEGETNFDQFNKIYS